MYLCVVPRHTDMTAVRLRESATYGLHLYAFLLGVTLLGCTCLALGVVLARPEIAALRGAGGGDMAALAAGGLLSFVGVSVLLIGLIGATYKLVADAVNVGQTHPANANQTTATAADPGAPDTAESAASATPDADASAEPQQAPGIDPDAEPATAERAPAADSGVSDEERSDVEAAEADVEEYGSRATEGPPEPSPEEIAFGSDEDDGAGDSTGAGMNDPVEDGEAMQESSEDEVSFDDEEPFDDDAVDEPTGSSGAVRPAGRNASSDPLADRSDGE